MYLKYGSFQFHPWEASFAGVSIEPQFTENNVRKYDTITFHVTGDVCGTNYSTQADINSRLQQIISAVAMDYQDIGLYLDDGTPTVHYLQSDHPLNMTGNQTFYSRWPEVKGGEFVSGRKFAFGVRAQVLDYIDNLIDYRDNIKLVGNAGPIYEWRRRRKWGHYPVRLANDSLQTVHHFGYAIGMLDRILPPTPLYPEPFLRNHRAEVTWTGRRRMGFAHIEPVTQWNYIYDLPVADDFIRPLEN